MRSLFSLAVLAFATAVSALSVVGDRLLVVLDDVAEKATYSTFLADLESRGHKITYETPKSETLSLFLHGERSYDNVLFFPVKAKGLGPNLTAQILLQFVKAKGNILVALSSASAAPSSLVSLLAELDMHLPPERRGLVVDHFGHDALSAADAHDVLLLPAPAPLRPDLVNFFAPEDGDDTTPIVAFPRSAPVTLGQGELLTPIVRAPATAYSYSPQDQGTVLPADELFAAGRQLALVAAMQARNTARVVVAASAEMLQDKWFDAEVKPAAGAKKMRTWNREFASRLAAWTFHKIGVLRVNWVEHHLNEQGVAGANVSNPKIYRVNNEVTYTISLSEWSWDHWRPFSVPAHDALQLEFSMLSPFERLGLAPDAARSTNSAAAYTASFRLPDQHGIFNFRVAYKRPFLAGVEEEKTTVSVRHMAHDEWPRSFAISGAWPWIAGVAATVAAWLAFCAVWMFSSAPPAAKEEKKTQ